MTTPDGSHVNVFFVCGSPKSGTTWLQRVLDAHPEVSCSGEGHFVQRFTLPVAKIIREYNEHVKLVAHRVYEGKPYYAPVDQPAFDRLMRAFIMDRLTSRGPGPQVKWVGDKTPRYTLHLKQLRRMFPEARFINIVRDPRDAMMSRLHHGRRAGYPDALTPGSEIRQKIVRDGAQDWVDNVRPIAEFSAAFPGALYGVRYEDMLADPAGEALRLFGFLGVSTDPAVIDEVVRTTSFEAQSGRKPGEENPDSFLRKGVAGDWNGRLEAEAVQVLEATCGELMRQYRYL